MIVVILHESSAKSHRPLNSKNRFAPAFVSVGNREKRDCLSSMKHLQRILFLLAAAGFIGWLWLRKTPSLADDLPPIAVAAFEFQEISTEQGQSIAVVSRSWPGITASAFNAESALLALTFTAAISETELLARLGGLAKTPVSRKIFPAPPGAKCPVPVEWLAALPGWCLAFGGLAAGLFLTTFLPVFSHKK